MPTGKISLRSLPRQGLGALTLRMLPLPADKFKASLVHETLAPRAATPTIYHDATEEAVFVIGGRAKVYLNGRPVGVAAGDTLLIPARVRHAIVAGPAGVEALSLFSPALDPRNPDVRPAGGPPEPKKKRTR